jgi:hypothetical protein
MGTEPSFRQARLDIGPQQPLIDAELHISGAWLAAGQPGDRAGTVDLARAAARAATWKEVLSLLHQASELA